MKTKDLMRQLCLDFTTFYLHNKWTFYLFKVCWKEEFVGTNCRAILQPARLGLLGSYTNNFMFVQVIVSDKDLDYLVSWLKRLLQKAEHIVSYKNPWPGHLELKESALTYESLEILLGKRGIKHYESACEPFLLINDWLFILLQNENTCFFFHDPIIFHDISNLDLMYSPLYYLQQKENFLYLQYKTPNPVQPYRHYFNCSFAEWWEYPCSEDTIVFHPTVFIFNKILECNLHYIEFELDDDTQFFEKFIREGLEDIDIACSYTYQAPKLRSYNRINLIIGYTFRRLEDIVKMNAYLLNYLQKLNPIIIDHKIFKEMDCRSYPNKVSRSVWTSSFKMSRLLCRRYDFVEWDGLDLDESLLYIKSPMQTLSVQKDIDYIKKNKRDFIYVYRYHDPFLKQKIEYNEKIQEA